MSARPDRAAQLAARRAYDRTSSVIPTLPGHVLPVPMAVVERAATREPLSPMQYTVAVLIGLCYERGEIARELDIAPSTVAAHMRVAAARIPGDLPARAKLAAWARGATRDVLEGHALRYEVEVLARRPRRIDDTRPV